MTGSLIGLTGLAVVLGLMSSRLVRVSAGLAPTPAAVHRMQGVLALITVVLTVAALKSVHTSPDITLVAAPLAVLISGAAMKAHDDDDDYYDGLARRLAPHLPAGSDAHAVAKAHTGWLALQNVVWIAAFIGPGAMLGLGNHIT